MVAHHRPEARAGSHPRPVRLADGALVVDEKRAWSATEAWDLADRIAHMVREATDGGRRRVAVFAENAGEAVFAHLQTWCADRLCFKCPRQIRVVESVQRNPLGKLDKRELRAAHS